MQALRLVSLLVCVPAFPLLAQMPGMERARPNDNRARAGISSGNILAVRIEARIAMWHPNGDDAPGAAIPVFAEIGRPSQVPGPLIRVPGGTDIIATVRNAIPNVTLTIHGLHSRPTPGQQFNDSIQLAPGAVQTLRFRLDRPGTYYYWGTITGKSFDGRTGDDAQLSGAIVVDEPGQRPARDRIFVLGMWADTVGSELSRHRQRQLFVINGRAWPHGDRTVTERGDSVRWRVINASADPQAMHLHGFYFRVSRRGDGRADTVQSARDLVHTERLPPGATMSMAWVGDRLGTWIFHSASPAHIAARGPMGMPLQGAPTLAQAGQLSTASVAGMGGLVTAVDVRPAEEDTAAAMMRPDPVRRLRMFVRPNLGSTPTRPFYSVAFDETAMEPELGVGQQAGQPLVLNRGEPVSITVLNRTQEATSIHWHGLEVESYYDGVPGVSGIRPQLAPAIAPQDSFEVRLTPQRAGTFVYHSHVGENRQMRAGIVGALLVVEKGRHDPARELAVLVSSPSDSLEEERAVLVNGSGNPAPEMLRRGIASRLRLINITTGRPGLRFELKQDTTLATWRPVAKDGAELPAARRVIRPARQPLAIGETMDVEFFPPRPGEYRLEIRTTLGVLLATLPLRVN